MKKVAIITLNYNGRQDTLGLLGSLGKLKAENIELRIIVVDNASEDDSVFAIHKQFPDADILQTGGNLGFSGGYNKGIEYASVWGADYFLLVNNDCLVKDQNLVSNLIKTLESNPKIGMVSPKIYFAPGFEYFKERYSKENSGKVIWFAGGSFDWDNIGNVHRGINEVDQGEYDQEEEAEIFSGACVLIKKEVLEKVGLLDERYFLYFEDSDYAIKTKIAGFKIYYNGSASIYHKVSRSTGIGSKITDYYHTRNRLIFGLKYAKPRTKFALLREAFRLLVSGRSAQRKGVLDFYLGMIGGVGDLKENKEPAYPIKLSIGIVNYNTSDLVKKLLESIFHKDCGFDNKSMEVIVLDNGLQDSCQDKIKEFLPKIKYLQNKENEGFSRGYNKTIKFSLGEYYLMLNSDIEVLEKGLSELIICADKLKGNAVLGGKLIFPDGSSQDSVFHLPTITGAFNEYFLAKKGSYFMFMPDSNMDKPVQVEGLVMACFFIPKKILQKAGLLDESKFIFFEDIEYCKRLKNNQIPIYFVPAAKFIHHHGASTKRIGLEKANKLLAQSSLKYHGQIYYFLLSWVLRLGQKFGRVATPVARWAKDETT